MFSHCFNFVKKKWNKMNNKEPEFVFTSVNIDEFIEEYGIDSESKEYNINSKLNELDDIVLVRLALSYDAFLSALIVETHSSSYFDFRKKYELLSPSEGTLNHIGYSDSDEECNSKIAESDTYQFNDDVRAIFIENLADALRLYIRIVSIYNKKIKLRSVVEACAEYLSKEDFSYSDLYKGSYTLLGLFYSVIAHWYDNNLYPILIGITQDNDLPIEKRMTYRSNVLQTISTLEELLNIKTKGDVYYNIYKLYQYTLYGFYKSPLLKENKSVTPLLRDLLDSSMYVNDYISKNPEINPEGLQFKELLFKRGFYKFNNDIHRLRTYIILAFICNLYLEAKTENSYNDIVITDKNGWL